MSFADALAYILFTAVVLLPFAMFSAAFKGLVKRWLVELLALIVVLGGLASLQYPGRGALMFNLSALTVMLGVCLISALFATLGFHRRNRANAEGSKCPS